MQSFWKLTAGTGVAMRSESCDEDRTSIISPFAAIAFVEKWVVRPSLAIGTSTARVPPDQSNSENLSSFGGRLDLCRRNAGNYIDRRGIELDVCAGGDSAYVWSARQSVVRASVGPSATLRGEIGQDFALELRTMFGLNLTRTGERGATADLAPFVAAAELGASVRFR